MSSISKEASSSAVSKEQDATEAQSTSKEPQEYHYIDIHSANPGNPIFTIDKHHAKQIHGMVTQPGPTEEQYRQQHPMYITTANSYGSLVPTAAAFPCSFHGKSQKFSQHLGTAGMYQNSSLNTSSDKTIF